jgi:hypothetical protein
MEGTGTPQLTESGQRGEDGNVDFLALFFGWAGGGGREGEGRFQMSSLLGKFQMSSLLEIFTGGGGGVQKSSLLEHEGRGGGVKIFSGPRKREGAKAGLLFFLVDPAASLFPQRHRDWVSRLTEGTPAGWKKKQRVTLAPCHFLGGWGQGEKKKAGMVLR